MLEKFRGKNKEITEVENPDLEEVKTTEETKKKMSFRTKLVLVGVGLGGLAAAAFGILKKSGSESIYNVDYTVNDYDNKDGNSVSDEPESDDEDPEK